MPNQSYPGVRVSCPSKVQVNGKGKSSFNIQLKFDPREAWRAGVFDDAFESQTEVDGWCVLNDGKDTLRVGYLAVSELEGSPYLQLCENRPYTGLTAAEIDRVIIEIGGLGDRIERAFSAGGDLF